MILSLSRNAGFDCNLDVFTRVTCLTNYSIPWSLNRSLIKGAGATGFLRRWNIPESDYAQVKKIGAASGCNNSAIAHRHRFYRSVSIHTKANRSTR